MVLQSNGADQTVIPPGTFFVTDPVEVFSGANCSAPVESVELSTGWNRCREDPNQQAVPAETNEDACSFDELDNAIARVREINNLNSPLVESTMSMPPSSLSTNTLSTSPTSHRAMDPVRVEHEVHTLLLCASRCRFAQSVDFSIV